LRREPNDPERVVDQARLRIPGVPDAALPPSADAFHRPWARATGAGADLGRGDRYAAAAVSAPELLEGDRGLAAPARRVRAEGGGADPGGGTNAVPGARLVARCDCAAAGAEAAGWEGAVPGRAAVSALHHSAAGVP